MEISWDAPFGVSEIDKQEYEERRKDLSRLALENLQGDAARLECNKCVFSNSLREISK